MLGYGAYGTVTVENGKAVKTFHKVNHLVQEWLACFYLRDGEYVVKALGFDLERRELVMPKYDTNLDDWMEESRRRPVAELQAVKWEILKCILKGLSEIHGRGLVHGDIKPDNILLNRQPLKVVIGDLGFTSLAQYAKVARTARPYRDWEYHPHPAHDINSFGILAMKLLGGFRPRHQSKPEEIAELVNRRLKGPENNRLRSLVLRCTQRDYLRRPSAAQLLDELFDLSTITLLKPNPVVNLGNNYPKLRAWVVEMAKHYKLNSAEKGCDALASYFSRHPEIRSFKLHCTAMLVILSSLYGKSGFTLNTGSIICKEIGNAKEGLIRALKALIADPVVTQGLLHV